MSGTALARREAVNTSTGEIVPIVPEFNMVEYLSSTTTKQAMEQQRALAAAYDAACHALIGENDIQKEAGREFKKKSAWRKLARHFRISVETGKVEREVLPDGHFLAIVTARAVAPWGQSYEEVGACCTDEATGRRVISVADAIATASTRASNRAVSNLIAMGEVSAEEIDKGEAKPRGEARGSARDAAKPDEEKLLPFGDKKGTPLGKLESEELLRVAKWCAEKGKFLDLGEACTNVVKRRQSAAAREEQAQAHEDEGFDDDRAAMEDDTDDGLPF